MGIADTLQKTLLLKNRADITQKLILHYRRPNAFTFELTGVDERDDSIYAVLLCSDRTYPLIEKEAGFRKADDPDRQTRDRYILREKYCYFMD